MKRQTFFSILGALCILVSLTSCYTEPNPLNSVAIVGGPVAIVRNVGFLNTTRVYGSDILAALPEAPLAATSTARLPNYAAIAAPTAGGTVTYVVEYSTLESPVTAVNLYQQSGNTRTRVANVSVNVAASPNRVRQAIQYTVPAGTATGARIILVSSVVTAGGESFSGTGIAAVGATPTAGTAVITVR
jgi:hypothetical protein